MMLEEVAREEPGDKQWNKYQSEEEEEEAVENNGGATSNASTVVVHQPQKSPQQQQLWPIFLKRSVSGPAASRDPSKYLSPKKQITASSSPPKKRSHSSPTIERRSSYPPFTNDAVSPPPPVRSCPFYKWIPDTRITVDAFRYGKIPDCDIYFLTHFHSDHYAGLSKNYNYGPIYCSQETSNLLRAELNVPSQYIFPLPLNETITILPGVQVTFMDANHCPGAVIILFELMNGRRSLHTGDFRANPMMLKHPKLALDPVADPRLKLIDTLFLDTTYCDPAYDFPPQSFVLNYIRNIVRSQLQQNPNTLIIIGTYLIGKEKVALAAMEGISGDVTIYANPRKTAILNMLNLSSLTGRLSNDALHSQIHIVSMSDVSAKNVVRYYKNYQTKWTSLLALRPTGWTHSSSISVSDLQPMVLCEGKVKVFGIPYSEHSSFTELELFVRKIQPTRIVPTVNIETEAKRQKMRRYFEEWLGRSC